MRFRRSLALIFSCLPLVACQTTAGLNEAILSVASIALCERVTRAHDSIVGGQTVGFADPDQKLVAQLTIHRGDRQSVCTASLLSDQVLMTAAHCVVGVSASAVEAQFVTKDGCPVNEQRRELIALEKIVVHPAFDGTPQSYSDVALLLLSKTAPSDQTRLPLMMPDQEPTSDQVLFLGFGITEADQSDSRVLRRISKKYSIDLKLKDKIIAVDQTGERGGFCRGDSGAPLIAELWGEPYILGINSANIGLTPKSECHTMSVAMRASSFAQWVKDNRTQLETKSIWQTLGERLSWLNHLL